jgi:murein DD-endopeptidase MepM/ murein hydrolase activator NlpD
MSDLLISNNSSVSSTSNLAGNTSSTSGTQTESATFQELLSCILLSSLSSTSDQNSDITKLLSPLMLLLEQLQSQQVSSQLQTSDSSSVANVSASTVNSSSTTDWNSNYPVQAPLTQDFHPGHNGLDFGVVVGTSVHSTINGKVIYAGWNDQGYGNLVIVDNGEYKTYYAHLSEIPVSVGQTIQKGEVVGLSGNTGNSTGPHLHYEVRQNNVPIDPATFDPTNL